MNWVDWLVLCSTLFAIVAYGTWKTRQQKGLNAYLLGGNQASWGTVGLSVMATQASAITFLSTPGQAFESGMGFLQFYFGLPLALIILSVTFIPRFYSLKVFTAYEYLEQRFDLRMRLVTAFLFLLQRGLAAGITIYAPAIVLSTVFQWNLNATIVVIGVLVIIYTVSGGTKAVSLTQKWQMAVIMGGMFFAFGTIIFYLREHLSFFDAIELAGIHGKMEIVNLEFDIKERYNIWSGLLGGMFLALSYFGTDQSQVQRYLSGSSIRESRMGLMFNASLKIPMQFFILLTGVLVFVFYQYNERPIHFNQNLVDTVLESERAEEGESLIAKFEKAQEEKQALMSDRKAHRAQLVALEQTQRALNEDFSTLANQVDESLETNDADYVFISYVLKYLPHGAIGLLLAVIFSAAMSSTASELNALGSTTMNDFQRRLRADSSEKAGDVATSKLITVIWGILAIIFAISASLVENLIELVNILGSLFYGTILGIFLCAFYLKFIRSTQVFVGAVVAQSTVFVLHILTVNGTFSLSYLWYNLIGCAVVVAIAAPLSVLNHSKSKH